MGFELETEMTEVQIHPEPLTLPMFLGTQACLDLMERVVLAGREGKTVYLSRWDASTGYAVGVIVDKGKPQRWSVFGPMGKEEAREYLDTQKLSFMPPAAGGVH